MDRARSLRNALGAYPTGVTLITHVRENRARAMTVNSFASVSLDPPLILWSVDKSSQRYPAFRDAGIFGVNVLSGDQQFLANACAADDDLEASGAVWEAGEAGAPLVIGAVARFACKRVAVHEAGDHDIIVGEVIAFDQPNQSPALVFHRSRYGVSEL